MLDLVHDAGRDHVHVGLHAPQVVPQGSPGESGRRGQVYEPPRDVARKIMLYYIILYLLYGTSVLR